VTAVSDAAAAWLALPASRAALGRIGQVPAPESPAGLARLVREDGARYARLIRSAGIRLE
jgi:tripartite-type tricarboxylate transporter receptor subunit TctC